MGEDTCPWHDACAKWPDCYPPDSIGAQLEDLVDRLAEVVGQEWRDEISRQVWAPFREAQARSLAIALHNIEMPEVAEMVRRHEKTKEADRG